VERTKRNMHAYVVAGLPMTILLRETPAAAIWKTAVPGNGLPEDSSRPLQSVYSEVPSEKQMHF
jgi:hypothetical protein